jgi:DNA gyrase subunit A
MSEITENIRPVKIEQELKQSYLDYAMSVIVGRALPDIRDGLKPVHRRILYAMYALSNDYNKAYKKSARIVGDVIGKYHPHGDNAVYDALVRLAQTFSMRYPLVDGQGNFGSIDGDPAAAMRYTEVRMSKIAHMLLADLEKETVDFVPNYDDSEIQPSILPTIVPNLLVNGSAGIAVGMATNIPPHNLGEVLTALLAYIENPQLSVVELMQYLPGPDFPTAGIISGRSGILDAYETGRGKIYIRGRVKIEDEDKGSRQSIVVTELPYQVNKARFVERIAELVKEKKLEGISALRDESDKDGMRVVIELKRNEIAEVILNNLYINTQLQISYGFNMVALVDGRPLIVGVKQIFDSFFKHRKQVVYRRTLYELNKARARAHILEGLTVALNHLDAIILLIRAAKNAALAKEQLMQTDWSGHQLSEAQAQAILDLKLQRLTSLERDKIIEEYNNVLQLIAELSAIIASDTKLVAVIRAELEQLKQDFADARLTEIIDEPISLTNEDLIPEESLVVTLSHNGYIKSQSLETYQAQKRGGKGKVAAGLKEEDAISHLVVVSTHAYLLCFSNLGKVYWLKGHQVPSGNREARGKPIVNLLSLQEHEQISALLPVRTFDAQQMVFMATSMGVAKQVPLSDFSRPRASGIAAINLDDGDTLVGAELTVAASEVLLTTSDGKALRFACTKVRAMGRAARGVRGIRLAAGQKVVSLLVLQQEANVLTATQNGFGKCSAAAAFQKKGRGGQGVIAIKVDERNGPVIGAIQLASDDDVLLISNQGTMVRIRAEEISVIGRNTKGVILMNVADGEYLSAIQRIVE